jgi:hypothetical protein
MSKIQKCVEVCVEVIYIEYDNMILYNKLENSILQIVRVDIFVKSIPGGTTKYPSRPARVFLFKINLLKRNSNFLVFTTI